MYVFYPADELLRIYENPIRESLSVDATSASADHEEVENQRYYLQQQLQQLQQQQQQQRVVASSNDARKRNKKQRKRETGQTEASRRQIARNAGINGTGKGERRRWEEQHAGTMQNNRASGSEEAANHPLKDLTQPSLNESLKQHNGVALKLVQTGKYASFLRFLPA
jgi:peptidoglycan hydrolase CwlO-like protein